MNDTFAPTANDISGKSHSASPSPSEISLALEHALKSDVFEGSSRLQDFLEYVVQQSLTDPSRKIPAKTIAHDLYGVTLGSGAESINVVRVDAGRLRRRLAEFYAGPGYDEPVIIHIDSGGYAPRFEVRERPILADDLKGSKGKNKLMTRPAIGVLLFTFGLGVLIGYLAAPKQSIPETNAILHPTSTSAAMKVERKAIMSKSASSIQAMTIAEQAQGLIFPVSERAQLELTVGLFKEAIRRDDGYFGGYSGAALSLSMLAIFSPNGPKREEFLTEARLLADTAVDLAPEEAWTQSALAWANFAEGNTDLALEHINIAYQLAPNDGNILDYYGFMMLSVGNFDAALVAASPDRKRTGNVENLSSYGTFGAANFHLGHYEETISSLLEGTFAGSPVSGPTLAYLAAASHALGHDRDADKYVAQLQKHWPLFRADVVLGRLFLDTSQAMTVHNHLLAAGWAPSIEIEANSDNFD